MSELMCPRDGLRCVCPDPCSQRAWCAESARLKAQPAAQDDGECRDNPSAPIHDWKTREATRGGIYEQCA